MLDDIENRLQRTSPKQLLICGDMCRTMNDACASAEAEAPAPASQSAGQPPRSAANVVRLFSTQVRPARQQLGNRGQMAGQNQEQSRDCGP